MYAYRFVSDRRGCYCQAERCSVEEWDGTVRRPVFLALPHFFESYPWPDFDASLQKHGKTGQWC